MPVVVPMPGNESLADGVAAALDDAHLHRIAIYPIPTQVVHAADDIARWVIANVRRRAQCQPVPTATSVLG